ncbi:MAG: hypothetical protein RSN88_09230, partial [Gordonibacter sp.]|uniref:hypothetical protein n=1 Tax=Gordonibacter sp. TaxID=1968902 RepID=UPI002FC788B4
YNQGRSRKRAAWRRRSPAAVGLQQGNVTKESCSYRGAEQRRCRRPPKKASAGGAVKLRIAKSIIGAKPSFIFLKYDLEKMIEI